MSHLIPCPTAQLLIYILKILESHLKSRYHVSFAGYNIIRNDNNSSFALLVRKDYLFGEVAIENLQISSAMAAVDKTTVARQILVVSGYFKCATESSPGSLGQSPVKVKMPSFLWGF